MIKKILAIIALNVINAFVSAAVATEGGDVEVRYNNGKDLVLKVANATVAEKVRVCHRTCANGDRVYISSVYDSSTEYSIVFATTPEKHVNEGIESYKECMADCLNVRDNQIGIQLDSDIIYASGRDYNEIAHILKTIGSSLGPGYEYIGSDDESSESTEIDQNGMVHAKRGRIEKPDNRMVDPSTFTSFALYTFREYFRNYVDDQRLIGEEKWSDLKCGQCYSLGGHIRRGMKLNYESDERDSVRIMYWPHHDCRSYKADGSNFGRGKVKEVLKHHWLDVGTADIASFWIQCNEHQGWPGPNTGRHVTWSVHHLAECKQSGSS